METSTAAIWSSVASVVEFLSFLFLHLTLLAEDTVTHWRVPFKPHWLAVAQSDRNVSHVLPEITTTWPVVRVESSPGR